MPRCVLCNQDLSNSSSLNRHRRTRHSATPEVFQCQTCSLVCNRQDTLQRHERSHVRDGWPECPFCSKKFRNDYLREHRAACERRAQKSNARSIPQEQHYSSNSDGPTDQSTSSQGFDSAALLDACYANDIELVRNVIRSNPNVNLGSVTPLQRALQSSSWQIVEILLRAGALAVLVSGQCIWDLKCQTFEKDQHEDQRVPYRDAERKVELLLQFGFDVWEDHWEIGS